jgi:hypothetical protein
MEVGTASRSRRQGTLAPHPISRRQGAEKDMAEKVKKLNLERNYKKYLYFIDGEGNVCQKPKSGEGESEVLVREAVNRDNQFLYFIDKEGDVSRSPRGSKRTASSKKAA